MIRTAAIVFLAVSALGCAVRSTATAVGYPSSSECGAVEITTIGSSFLNAFTLKYEVSSPDTDQWLCLRDPRFVDGRMEYYVQMHPAAAQFPPTMEISPAVWMNKRRPRVSRMPSLNRVTVWDDGGVIGAVPAGEYKLALYYRLPPCLPRHADSECVAVSDPFTIEETIDYAVER